MCVTERIHGEKNLLYQQTELFIYILSKKYRELIVQKARLNRLSKPRSGRPLTSSTEVNIAKVKEMVTENRNLSLREIPVELSVPHESICTISNDCLSMKRVAARLVPKDQLTRLSL